LSERERHARLDFCLWQPRGKMNELWNYLRRKMSWITKIFIDDEKKSRNWFWCVGEAPVKVLIIMLNSKMKKNVINWIDTQIFICHFNSFNSFHHSRCTNASQLLLFIIFPRVSAEVILPDWAASRRKMGNMFTEAMASAVLTKSFSVF
jgi:hypothetical protein